jgi:DNA repair protein endonuclease SAE2/CtIP C-terminus
LRLDDFKIVPENNYGVAHAFNETIRGKEARKSLPATSCPDCTKVHSLYLIFDLSQFYEFHGPIAVSAMNSCKHQTRPGNQHIQKVSKHRSAWESESKPAGFWYSGFPTSDEINKNREEEERQNAERVRRVAEEAASKNGRWETKDTTRQF